MRDEKLGTTRLWPGGQLGAAADHVQLALERVAFEVRRGGDEQLTDQRRDPRGGVADVARVDGNVAPADDALSLLFDRRLEQTLELGPTRGLSRQEAHSDAVAPGRRQLVVESSAEERVGDLDEDPRPVAGARVRARGAAMLEVGERGQRTVDRLVRWRAVEPSDEGDAARVVLARRIVEAGRLHPVTLSPVLCELVR